ncbi:MAG TPA: UDP-glucose/GDP-mannose dehydrogenase family protein [Candidatus Hydrogenedens sp.]|nr:UDP-glucose/GDP-mannose dehydrogenase family protein [Candidatus Hydrogenedens sp.]HOK08029.1 UDP-glucose/GDP-mannose dehydrogenase family protein [Candidatus Hydrogenedens sp.]HOL20674.1 UDP-glucose/GDP-mannose dehydrogenase family protein [Candidatus Hydrogenedens sp.]HPP57978.1 UDP-glucose/GDP-mannose dehydrogenase family protein [Candidatus Hydrogenedens sp.]
MKITVIGTGYQGLVVGTCFAESGHIVTCVDWEKERIELLKRGDIPIYEPGLSELVSRNIEEERLFFTDSLDDAIQNCLLIFLCMDIVSYPSIDDVVQPILDVAKVIARVMTGYRIVVNKITSPPGTADKIKAVMKEHTQHPFDIVVNPDFLKQGTAVDDFLRPDRVVVGCEDVRVQEIIKELYSPFLRTGKPLLIMSLRSAELSKYATAVMLAGRVSIINQIAELCEAWGANISEVREAVGADSRIGLNFLFPGIGYGGVWLPKDVDSCILFAKEKGISYHIFESIQKVNQEQREKFLSMVLKYYNNCVEGRVLTIWGASFKARTDDIRGAPSIYIIEELLGRGAKIRIFDPLSGPKLKEKFGNQIDIATKQYPPLEGSEGLIILTEWNEFRRPDYERMAQLMKEKVIFDGRNLYTPKTMASYGFRYYSIGRPPVE